MTIYFVDTLGKTNSHNVFNQNMLAFYFLSRKHERKMGLGVFEPSNRYFIPWNTTTKDYDPPESNISTEWEHTVMTAAEYKTYIALPIGNALTTTDFIQSYIPTHIPICLTIQDVLALRNGEKLTLLRLDRNWDDTVYCDNLPNKKYKATDFFRALKSTYIHREGLCGLLEFHDSDDEDGNQEFEFHIEYSTNRWYPLNNGYLPTRDPQEVAGFHYSEPKHWSTFPVSTRIGWRGPMVLWQHVDSIPRIMREPYFCT